MSFANLSHMQIGNNKNIVHGGLKKAPEHASEQMFLCYFNSMHGGRSQEHASVFKYQKKCLITYDFKISQTPHVENDPPIVWTRVSKILAHHCIGLTLD